MQGIFPMKNLHISSITLPKKKSMKLHCIAFN